MTTEYKPTISPVVVEGTAVSKKPRGCTCGYPRWDGASFHYHTFECQLKIGPNVGLVLKRIAHEVDSARSKFPKFNSPHEGYAVIAEEVEELWSHAKANSGRTDEAMVEAIQIAAMAVRYVLDLSEGPVAW